MPIGKRAEDYSGDISEWVSNRLEGEVTEAQVRRLIREVSWVMCNKLREGLWVRVPFFNFATTSRYMTFSMRRQRYDHRPQEMFLDYPGYVDPEILDKGEKK